MIVAWIILFLISKINLNLIKKNPFSLPAILADKEGIFKKYDIDMNLYLDEAAMIFNNLNNEEKAQIFTEYCGYEREVAESFKEFTFEKSSNYREEDFNLCQEWMYREGEIKRLFDANVLIKDII